MKAPWTEPERVVLGSIMLDQSNFDRARGEGACLNWFITPVTRAIFSAISEVMDQASPVLDPVIIGENLTKKRLIPDPVSWESLDDLTKGIPRVANIRHYSGILQDNWERRQVSGIADKLKNSVRDGLDAQTLISNAHVWLDSIKGDGGQVSWEKSLSLASSNMAIYEDRQKNKGKRCGVFVGFDALDNRWNGLQPGNFTVIAARPGMGKTYLGLQIGQSAASHTGVAFFSLEMPKDQLQMRLDSVNTGVPLFKLRDGSMNGGDWAMLTGNQLASDQYFINDESGLDFAGIRERFRLLLKKTPIGLVIVDYLGLVSATGGKNESTAYKIERLANQLKGMAKEFNTHVIALCQLNRGVEQRQNKRPMLSDLRESGGIEQAADMVVFIHREGYWAQEKDSNLEDQIAEIITAKFRNGSPGTDELIWRPSIPVFANPMGGW